MASAAADGLLLPIYEGCIAGFDNDVERRPYHKNCGCALHSKSGKKACNGKRAKCNSVSYPMRRAWSEGSLLVLASASGNSSPSSPAFRPQQEEELGQHHHHHHQH